jgi:hypothetical protein
MQKKAINGLLITLCIIIYGAIFFKAFWEKEVIDNSNKAIQNYVSVDINYSKPKDSITLFFPERSPFGEPSRIAKVNNTTVKKRINSLKTNKTQKTIWPSINYYGFVKNKLSSKKLLAITIDDKMYKLKELDVINGFKIIEVYSDSIIIQKNNEVRAYEKFKD